ncbi:uncharacterized protein LOC121634025 [Melanotaenia boesemani]|uniref:uncharacterized protein LOC121634025 n=1 Tax=Melanotaenia boesemani TaxID=1250792 RepID=UPI001C03B3F0|nr:uncharacterized protein LOC121634025 [Melanotaenia boesemani]
MLSCHSDLSARVFTKHCDPAIQRTSRYTALSTKIDSINKKKERKNERKKERKREKSVVLSPCADMSAGEMCGLLEEIQIFNQDAAFILGRADICTDSEIQSLSEEDLYELFPGVNQLKLRVTISEIIQKREPINVTLQDQKSFVPDGDIWDALSSSKTLADHLPILKAWKDKMEKLQRFLDAHVNLVENLTHTQPGQKADRDVHPGSKTLVDHLPILKAWKDEVEKWPSFNEAYIKVVENTIKAQPDQQPDGDEMCALLKKIHKIDPEAVHVLREAEICTDSEIQSLSRQDLHEMFPGVEKLYLRRTIFKIIHTEKPTFVSPKEPKPFLPDGNPRDAHSCSKTLADHLPTQKACEVEKLLSFLEDQIKVVENTIKCQPDQKPDRGILPGTSNSFPCAQMEMETNTSAYIQPNRAQGVDKENKSQSNKGGEASNRQMEQQSSSGGFLSRLLSLGSSAVSSQEEREYKRLKDNKASVGLEPARKRFSGLHTTQEILKYKMVVSGETFNAHHQLLGEIKSSIQEFKIVEADVSQNSEDYQIIIVFCPVVSRIGTDVNEAMKEVPGNKPVILVLMHHAYEARHVASIKAPDKNIVLYVDVFYHETVKGLISCNQNKNAVFEMRNKIIEMRKRK